MGPTDSENHKGQTVAPLTKGSPVAHYAIVEKIGAGGMGEVYLAEDTRLNRRVALKFLPLHLSSDEELKTRFKREAQAAAALTHPNIVTIHEVNEFQGRAFFAMEYVKGGCLAGLLKNREMSLDQIVDIAIPTVEGLREAHDEGVIHRDIKPSNILVDKSGRPKIVDFGLAVVRGTTRVTRTGSMLGTLAYMSPEQARGKPVDHRSDLFSFGVVLHEMITGRSPFARDTEAATIDAVINSVPEPLARYKSSVPDELQRIVSKLLEKDPALRYQSAADLVSDLKRLALTLEGRVAAPVQKTRKSRSLVAAIVFVLIVAVVGHVAKLVLLPDTKAPPTKALALGKKMLAVLPLRNLGSPEDEYFADGITEEILTSLAGFSGLGVISRTSAMQYKNTDKSVREIGAELGVEYVLEGTIQWDKSVSPPRVRLHEQLIRVSDDVHLWGQRYDAVINDIFEVQSAVAEKVVEALDVFLGESERQALRAAPTDNPEAYDYFLRGIDYGSKNFEEETLGIAVQMLEKAVELDPKFARAYAVLSVIHVSQYSFYHDRTEERLAKAKQAADSAFQIEPDSPEAHWAMGWYYYHGFLNYDAAMKHFRIAEQKLKNNPHVLFGMACVQRRQGKLQEAFLNFRKAVRLDPRSIILAIGIGETFALTGDFKEAERYYARAISMSPDSPTPYEAMVSLYLRWEGRTNKARKFLENAPKSVISSQHPSIVQHLALMDVYDGNYEAALDRLSRYPGAIFEGRPRPRFTPKDLLCAQICGLLNDAKSKEAFYESAVRVLIPLVEERPDDHRFRSALGLAYAGLGRKEEAIREGKLGVELLPVDKDAVDGPYPLESLVRIHVMLGEYDEALAQLRFLLSLPSGPWIPLLRLDPVWEPLRSHPQFQELLRQYDSFAAAMSGK